MLVCLKVIGTGFVGTLMLVSGIMLADKALTPLPQPRETHPADRRLAAENDLLVRENNALRLRVVELEMDNATLKINVECLMKVAVFPPARTAAGADMIPPQDVPTRPIE